MKTAELLSTLSIVSFVIAAVCLVLAIVLWIYFRIPRVIGDLSGKNAKKSIARMRAYNESSGNKSYKSSKTNAARGTLTETIPDIKRSPDKTPAVQETKKKPAAAQKVIPMQPKPAPAPVKAQRGFSEETVLLNESSETVLLNETPREAPVRVGGVKLTMLDDVMMIHTSEVIA